jgi:hypothetical protein
MRKSLLFILSFVFTLQLLHAQEEKTDMDMVNKIRKEGLENSKVMEIAMWDHVCLWNPPIFPTIL